jgi:hypothetical protein
MTRQTLARPDLSGFIAAQPPASRDRTWEKTHPTVSYRLTIDVRNKITQLAADLNVPTSDLARAFLEYGIDAFLAGELDLHPHLKQGKFTLYD